MNKAIYQKLNQYFSRTTSRRDFIQAVTALGLTGLAAESLLASVQRGVAIGEGGPQSMRIVEGTTGELLVKQLKAIGVKYILLHDFQRCLAYA